MKRIILIIGLVVLTFCSYSLAKEEYPFIGLVTSENINVRSGANINFEALCKLVTNEKVTVLGKNYNWYKILLPKDATCYINQKYVRIEEGSQGIVTANKVNIRAKPGENFSIVGQANKGQGVKILKRAPQWYGIEPTDNCFGWVHEKFIRCYSPTDDITAQREAKSFLSETRKGEVISKEPLKENLISAVGVVEPMGKVFNRPGTHKLASNGKTLYILSGDRRQLDNFINYRVKVIGEENKSQSAKYPVITVKQITACE